MSVEKETDYKELTLSLWWLLLHHIYEKLFVSSLY